MSPLAVRKSEDRANASLEALACLATAVLLVDDANAVSYANLQARQLLGCGDVPTMPIERLFAQSGVTGSIPLPGGAGENRTQAVLSDGRAIAIEARRLPSGGAVLTLDDVSAFVREAERGRVDPLTGLSNRIALHTTLQDLLRESRPLAIFALDLDRFKNVNDTLGHQLGDALLRKVAERLSGLVRAGDLVARLGGDEFTIVVPGMTTTTAAEALARRIVDLIGRTYVLEGHMLNVGVSVGVTFSPADGRDEDVLLKNADLALYSAKADGRGRFSFFEPAMDARMQARRAIELDLRRALALREFELLYQPQVELETHEVVGFEALLRWHHAERGTVSPAAFIPIAEETGLIVPIGEWVLRTACREAATWSQPASVAVNLSALQFRSSKLIHTVVSALTTAGLDPARLELEITESALMDDTEVVVRTLTTLRSLGVKVSMDDFGTGYSSLSYLQKFPFDKIKIDQSFVRDIHHNAEASAIVRAVARLGASLGMKTTAEGVETEEQLAAIRAEGCNHVQGYLTGRPMAGADAAALLGAAQPVARRA